MHRNSCIALLCTLLVLVSACSNKKVNNPLANVGSKQPDKVLFDKAMDAMKHNRYDVARMTLQTLINTYPDSEYIARAKLAVGDSWYAEGGTASLAQAEQEYRDFETFFPNMPEAAEAQLKIANIQYQQMEKADRDYTHAKRAEEEYRNLIMQYPDNAKLVKEGKLRLLEVQEVLAEREFEIGRFYYLRGSFDASIARLQSLVEKYPLYSKADETLFLLGQDYEGKVARVRNAPRCQSPGKPPGCLADKDKEALLAKITPPMTKKAAEAYDQILTRYPLMDRGDDAKKRLAALHQPIPRPTKAAVAQNRAEEQSRKDDIGLAHLIDVMKRGPDVSQSSKVGEPSLTDPTPVSAKDVTTASMREAMGLPAGEKSLTIEAVKDGTPGSNEPAPRSDSQPATNANPFANPAVAADPNELKPTTSSAESAGPKPGAASDPNELTPNQAATAANSEAPLPPPVQLNELQQDQNSQASSASSSSSLATDKDISTSKKKKKKGLKKIIAL